MYLALIKLQRPLKCAESTVRIHSYIRNNGNLTVLTPHSMSEKELDTLTLTSSFDEIERLEPFLEDLQEKAGFGDDPFERIRLAVNEAVTNAVVHGNKEDDSKSVHITAYSEKSGLIISVQDEGPGFDPQTLPDPLQEENLLKDSGRGIFLIKQYADEVEFSENATKLTMRFMPGEK